jgi:hypothetical protein
LPEGSEPLPQEIPPRVVLLIYPKHGEPDDGGVPVEKVKLVDPNNAPMTFWDVDVPDRFPAAVNPLGGFCHPCAVAPEFMPQT